MESMGKRGHGWVRGLCYVAGKRKTTEGVSMHTVNENAAGQAENRFGQGAKTRFGPGQAENDGLCSGLYVAGQAENRSVQRLMGASL
jgi:hypothetical protein